MATLVQRITDLASAAAGEIKSVRTLVNGNAANLDALTTTTKTNLVAALNTLQTELDAVEAAAAAATNINDSAAGATTTYSSNKIASLVSAIREVEVTTVATQVAQLALTSEEGHIVVRSDLGKTFIHNGGALGTMSDWTVLPTLDINDSAASATSVYSSTKVAALVSAVQGEVDTLEGGVTTLSGTVTSNASAIRSEFATADTQIRTDFAAADTTLQTNINTVASNLATANTNWAAADTALDGRLDDVEEDLSNLINDGAATTTNVYSSEKTLDVAEAAAAAIISDAAANNVTDKTYSASKISSLISTAVSGIVDSAPGTLDTLNELAAALGDDANFATSTATALGYRLRFDEAQTLTADQKTQGLANLGAASTASVATVASNLSTLSTAIGTPDTNFVTTFTAALAD